MAFHHEWTWYNIYYPNPDAAICRLGMDEDEWHRSTTRKNTPWFKDSDSCTIMLNNRRNLMPDAIAYNTLIDQQKPQNRNAAPEFNYENFYRLLHQRKQLVRCGLLPPELPDPYPPCYNFK
ncbi:unnamed protein product [Candidula unifasciata]|uniref:Uncharacterized protein n=1 Tax=Candidula unifasciata TaxID=100452 RepID=A0A8S3YMC2_9EUPU|nr:unnamed protein product [Candidula unifasciata]